MHSPNPVPLILAALLLSMAGCATSPAPCPVVPRQALDLPPLPAEVMDSPIPDYLAWLERILSSSMRRLGLTSPSSPSAHEAPAKP